MWFDAPVALPGWEVFMGVDLFGYYDFACYGPDRSPNINQCQYHGTAQVCTTDTLLVTPHVADKSFVNGTWYSSRVLPAAMFYV